MADKNISIEESIQKIKEAYCELSKAVGGFSPDQRDKILNICFENAWRNCGYDKSILKVREILTGEKLK